jgi:hypothetical protein
MEQRKKVTNYHDEQKMFWYKQMQSVKRFLTTAGDIDSPYAKRQKEEDDWLEGDTRLGFVYLSYYSTINALMRQTHFAQPLPPTPPQFDTTVLGNFITVPDPLIRWEERTVSSASEEVTVVANQPATGLPGGGEAIGRVLFV